MTAESPSYLAGVEQAHLPLDHAEVDGTIAQATEGEQLADYFRGRRERLAAPIQ
jgi:hypothetical protein